MNSLIQKLRVLWAPTGCSEYRQVRVAGEIVKLTPSQARRYEELQRARRAGQLLGH